MKDLDKLGKESFIWAKSSYHGGSFPQGFLLNANLQEFSQKVSYIANLHSNGKISSQQACQQIENLWQEFKRIKKINCDSQYYA
jgi:hypothetical protein